MCSLCPSVSLSLCLSVSLSHLPAHVLHVLLMRVGVEVVDKGAEVAEPGVRARVRVCMCVCVCVCVVFVCVQV